MTTYQRKFWLCVSDCIVQLHGVSGTAAKQIVKQFSETIVNSGDEAVYEEEPFWVACSLMNSDLDIRVHLQDYIFILELNRLN